MAGLEKTFSRMRFLSALVAGFFLAAVSAAPATFGAEDDEEALLFAAEQVIFYKETREVTAEGHVELSHKGYALRADRVTFNEITGIVHAEGNVIITEPGGNKLYLDEAKLDKDLREGFITNLRLVFEDGSRLAAQDGERVEGNKTILNYAVFTPCVICDDHPEKPPSWQVRAVKVTHDQEKHRIYYKNATLEVLGVPIAFLPYLSHPDPSVDRASGFLAPEIDARRELGLILKIPYYFALSPSSDATFTPIITTKEGLVLSGEFRKRFTQGTFTTQGSVTRTDQRDNFNMLTGKKEFRGHLFANAEYDWSDNLRTKLQFQLASDDTYLRRYGFSNADTLESELHTEYFHGRSYYSIRSLWFQGLRLEDIQGLAGFALPLVELNYLTEPDRLGGTWNIYFNGLALHRTDGMDTRRMSLRASYEIPYTTKAGQILKLSLNMRSDLYNISNAERPDSLFYAGQNGTEARFLPYLSASFEWPFLKTSGRSQQIITPVVNLVVAPNGGNPSVLSNEDSRTFELTDTNILATDRMPGLDQWEGGTRINFGLKYLVVTDPVTVDAFVGESYRFSVAGSDPEDIYFSAGSGLSGHLSDLVTRLIVTFHDAVQISSRMRLDKDNFTVRRNEIDASFYFYNARIGVNYYKLRRDRLIEELPDREEIRIHGTYAINEEWRVFGDITRNLTTTGATISQGLGFMYVDDCLEFSFSWRKSFTSDRDIVPGNSVHVRLRLKQIG